MYTGRQICIRKDFFQLLTVILLSFSARKKKCVLYAETITVQIKGLVNFTSSSQAKWKRTV